MPEYICKQCNFYTINKTKYNEHLSTKKHKNYIKGITMKHRSKTIWNIFVNIVVNNLQI